MMKYSKSNFASGTFKIFAISTRYILSIIYKILLCDLKRVNLFNSSDFIDETRNVRSFEKANLWASIGGTHRKAL